MTTTWTPEDYKAFRTYGPAEFLKWLTEGLRDWSDSKTLQRAFAPISDCFTPSDDIEPQIAEMVKCMGDASLRAEFLLGISNGFRTAPTNPEGGELFASLQRIVANAGFPSPTEAMVLRLTRDPDFLDAFEPSMAEHLFANAFRTIEGAWSVDSVDDLLARLKKHRRYKPEYNDYTKRIARAAREFRKEH